MKKLILSFLPIFILSSQVFAIAGFGLNLNQSLYNISAETKTVGTAITYGNKEFSNGVGLGGYLYIDAIPFIDLDLELNTFWSKYDYFFILNDETTNYNNLPFGSFSGYFTIQKKLFQIKIPLLAKAKLTAGVGLNNQTYKSTPTQKDLESLLGLGDGLLADASGSPDLDKLKDFIKDNTESISGFHIQAGLQFKLLMLDSFLFYRQVIVDDVIPGAKGFGSLNLRLGMGF